MERGLHREPSKTGQMHPQTWQRLRVELGIHLGLFLGSGGGGMKVICGAVSPLRDPPKKDRTFCRILG